MRFILMVLLVLGLLDASKLSDVQKLNLEYKGYKLGEVFKENNAKKLSFKSKIYNKYLVNNDMLIVTDKKENRIVVIRKKFTKLPKKELKSLISSLIYKNGEPTAIAHEKMIYWIYDENKKKYTEEDILKFKDEVSNKQFLASYLKSMSSGSKNFKPYVTVKLASNVNIFDKNNTKDANVDIIYSFTKYLNDHAK